MIFSTFLVVTITLAVLTLMPLWRCEAWWVRSLDFPRLQLFLISLILLVMEMVLLDLSHFGAWGLLVVTLSCLVYHAWWIVPYTRLFPVEVESAINADDQKTIRIMTANVLTTNRNAKALIELVLELGRHKAQNGLDADADDLSRAKVKADDQGVSKSDVPRPGRH